MVVGAGGILRQPHLPLVQQVTDGGTRRPLPLLRLLLLSLGPLLLGLLRLPLPIWLPLLLLLLPLCPPLRPGRGSPTPTAAIGLL